MRRVSLLALPLLALALAGCPKKPKDGNCSSNDDCKAQQGYGKVCVQGRCQECAADPDCPAGFACKDNKCAPRAECDDTRPCPAGKACQAGRCVTSDAGAGAGAGGKESQQPTGPVCEMQKIYFGFDEATLSPDARDALTRDADCMKRLAAKKVVVEGHCDERGTTEYNQHLGQRRAESVKRFLVNLGVEGGAVDTVSYGKEQPVCTESGEDCWKKNRRAELKAR